MKRKVIEHGTTCLRTIICTLVSIVLSDYKNYLHIRGSFEKFVDWRQGTAVIQKEVVIIMPSFSGGGNIVVA
jgi:hypothetical protein